jgi:hypothetical protein
MCGTLPVPLDRRHPEKEKIEIYFELYLHSKPGPVFEGKWLATWERRSLRLVYSRDVLHPIGLPCLALIWRVSLFPVTRCRSNLGP